MMAVEKTAKRPSQGLASSVEPKKRKVGFADEVMSKIDRNNDVQNNKEFSMTLYRNFVRNALEDLEKNDTSQIETLANQLALPASSPDKISPENFNILLRILSNNINRVDNHHCITLIQSIINYDKWWELPSTTLSSYIFFIRILCSSLPKWWQDLSLILISNFTLSMSKTTTHHEMLKYFLKAIPSSTSFIDSYIAKFFPNKNDSKKNMVNYVSNVLRLTEYCSELRFQSWSLVIEKVISIDVELQNELDELDDDIEDDIDDELDSEDSEDENMHEEEDQGQNGKNDDPIGFIPEEDDDMEGDEEYNVEVSQNIKELSSKLDAILSLITKQLSCSLTAESIENGDGVSIFNTLTSLFKTHILPTYYTKSIQYIMFHVSQQQLELMDAFLVTLIDISFSPNENAEKKVKSLQYIGSFIARAKKLSKTQIIFVASYLTSWLNRYVLEREDEVDQSGGMERFKHFYAAFQALCYIFCFRHSLFRDGDSWECEIDKFFQRMVISKFNPLKFCNENVMMMFARIAQHEGVVYCFSIIENNNNERLRGIMGKADSNMPSSASSTGTSSTSSWSLVARQQFIDLQSYFPYDPLFLKNYKRMMKDYYIEWSDVSGDYESDESDEYDEMNKDT